MPEAIVKLDPVRIRLAESRTVMTSTADASVVSASLDAFEGGARILART